MSWKLYHLPNLHAVPSALSCKETEECLNRECLSWSEMPGEMVWFGWHACLVVKQHKHLYKIDSFEEPDWKSYKSFAVKVPHRTLASSPHLQQKGLELNEALAQDCCGWVESAWKAARKESSTDFYTYFPTVAWALLWEDWLWGRVGDLFFVVSCCQHFRYNVYIAGWILG